MFRESRIAHKYLDGLKGIEIGGGAHNPFGLDTINVNREDNHDSDNKHDELRHCGSTMPVDVVADGDNLPFKDDEFDFVISSHVIEHFYDPISALLEWKRVTSKYIFMIVPHKERTYDKDKPLTTLDEITSRFLDKNDEDKHWSIWNTSTFVELLEFMGFKDFEIWDKDDKVGNGFMVLIRL